MTHVRAAWRAVYLTYPCPSCGADPGADCTTSSGKRADVVHAGRTQHSARCPRCSDVLAADDEPGALCQRCRLLRSLEIERVTKHRRVT